MSYSIETLTKTGTVDLSKTAHIIDMGVSEVSGVFTLPLISTSAVGQFHHVYRRDGVAIPVSIKTTSPDVFCDDTNEIFLLRFNHFKILVGSTSGKWDILWGA